MRVNSYKYKTSLQLANVWSNLARLLVLTTQQQAMFVFLGID